MRAGAAKPLVQPAGRTDSVVGLADLRPARTLDLAFAYSPEHLAGNLARRRRRGWGELVSRRNFFVRHRSGLRLLPRLFRNGKRAVGAIAAAQARAHAGARLDQGAAHPLGTAVVVVFVLALHYSGIFDPAAGPEKAATESARSPFERDRRALLWHLLVSDLPAAEGFVRGLRRPAALRRVHAGRAQRRSASSAR